MEIITINMLNRVYEKNSLDAAHEIIISKYSDYIKTLYNLDITKKIKFPESIPECVRGKMEKIIIMCLIKHEKEIRGALLNILFKNEVRFASFVDYFINEGFNLGRLVILTAVTIVSETQKYFDEYEPLREAITKMINL